MNFKRAQKSHSDNCESGGGKEWVKNEVSEALTDDEGHVADEQIQQQVGAGWVVSRGVQTQDDAESNTPVTKRESMLRVTVS